MAGPYIVAADVKQDVADCLHKDVAKLKPLWDRITADAVIDGYTDVRNRLLIKGFTDAQVDAWDDRVRYTRDQSLFWALTKGANFGEYSDRDINKLDHRKELESPFLIAISINGAMQKPGATVGGPVQSGTVVTQSDGVDYGTTFGLKVNRWGGKNEYGDDVRQW